MMYKLIIVSALLILFLSCSARDNSVTEYNISTYFEEVSRIYIDTLNYEGIKYLDVNNDGELLVTTESRNEVFIYDSVGNYKLRLSELADSLFPGFNWNPNRAFFLNDGDIFLSNNGPWGARLQREDYSLVPLDRTYVAGFDLAFDEENNIYSFNSNNLGIHITKFSDEGEVLIPKFGHYPKGFKNIINKAIIGNSLVVAGDYIFFKTIAEAKIYKYSNTGELLDTFEKKPRYYREPKKDVRSEPLNVLIQDIRDFAEAYTANYSIHKLSDNKILVQYSNYNYEYGIQIFSATGKNILPTGLLTDKKILFTANNLIYTIDAKHYNFDQNYIPEIIKYKLREEFRY